MQLNIMTSDGKKPVEVIAEFDYMDYEFFVSDGDGIFSVTEKSCGHRVAWIDRETITEAMAVSLGKHELEQNMKRATFDKFELMVRNAIDKWGKAN